MKRVAFIGPLLFLITACGSRGLHVEPLQETLRREAVSFEATGPATMTPPARRSQNPPVLGLYLKPAYQFRRAFDWTDRDRDLILGWGRKLSSQGILAGATAVAPASLKGNTLTELREAATRYGIDVLLVFDGAAEVDRYNNYKAPLLYWTIIGAYLADGTHSDGLALIRATVWETKSGSMLSSEVAEGRADRVGPAAFVEDNTVLNEAKTRALEELLRRLEVQLQRPRGPR